MAFQGVNFFCTLVGGQDLRLLLVELAPDPSSTEDREGAVADLRGTKQDGNMAVRQLGTSSVLLHSLGNSKRTSSNVKWAFGQKMLR